MIIEYLEFFIFAFTSIFVIVDPISGAITFVSMTSEMTNEEKNKIAKKAVTLACAIALFFAITGSVILHLFNISIDSLRIARRRPPLCPAVRPRPTPRRWQAPSTSTATARPMQPPPRPSASPYRM